MHFNALVVIIIFFITFATPTHSIDDHSDHSSKHLSLEKSGDSLSIRKKRETKYDSNENQTRKEDGSSKRGERSKMRQLETEQQAEEQKKRLEQERLKCLELEFNSIANQTVQDGTKVKEVKKCPVIWDGALCWPSTTPGRIVSKKCPVYVHGFNHKGSATRHCLPSGSWEINESTNNTWTNYSQCMTTLIAIDDLLPNTNNYQFEDHIGRIQLITKTGYSVSLVSLVLAFIILTGIKRLRCPRNSLHLQLFVSFMIRSSVFLIKSAYFAPDPIPHIPGFYPGDTTNGAGGSSLLESIGSLGEENGNGIDSQAIEEAITKSMEMFGSDPKEIFFRTSSTISCKIFTVIWQYSLIANYNWILMEGIYLHNLIFLHIFNDNSSILKYVIAGWGLPLLFIIPWTIVRAAFEDTLCWTTNQNMSIYWIIRGPVTLSIIMNAFFFVRITRVVFIKMFMPPTRPSESNNNNLNQTNRVTNYKKWFKSTLVLVPLFGVHHIFLLLFNSLSLISGNLEIVWLYVDLLFTSFQGFFVALLYCFLNGEVQTELTKLWNRHRPAFLKRSCRHGSNNGRDAHGNMILNNGNGQNSSFPHSVTYNSILTQSLNHLAGKTMNAMTNSNTLPNIVAGGGRTDGKRGNSLIVNGRAQSNPCSDGGNNVMDSIPLIVQTQSKSTGTSPVRDDGNKLLTEPLQVTSHESCFIKDGC